jgi:hypothetical protein
METPQSQLTLVVTSGLNKCCVSSGGELISFPLFELLFTLFSVRMYRIKTDIRQYKCDTKEKVEKLIRNWVIRPNDLIYLADQQRWSPIGEHPTFLDLFAMLEAQERAEPDTVVTTNPLASAPEPLADEPVEEVTRIKERPAALADLSPESSEESTKDSAPVVPEVESSDLDLRETIEGDSVVPPTPEGVEPPVRSDEVTMMTERTFDLLKVTDEVDPVESSSAEPAEPTVEVNFRDETLELGNSVSAVEEIAAASDRFNPLEISKPRMGRHDLPEDFFATNELDGPVDRETLRDDLAAFEDKKSKHTEKPESTAVEAAEVVEDNEQDELAGEVWEIEDDLVDITAGLENTSVAEEQDSDEIHDDEDEWDEYDDLDPVEISARLLEKPSDRIADVYNIPLPFEIVPTPEELEAGIRRSKRSEAAKALAFPYPVEKKFKTAQLVTFDFTKEPPADQSRWLIAGVIGFVVLAVLAFALT